MKIFKRCRAQGIPPKNCQGPAGRFSNFQILPAQSNGIWKKKRRKKVCVLSVVRQRKQTKHWTQDLHFLVSGKMYKLSANANATNY